MYIWVVLAVFMVSLATFNVPVRNDMNEVTEVPRAESPIISLIQQHEAAVRLMRTPEGCVVVPTTGSASTRTIASNLITETDSPEKLIGTNYIYSQDIRQTFSCLNNDCTSGQGIVASFMRIPPEWTERVQGGGKDGVSGGQEVGSSKEIPNIHLRTALMNRTGAKKMGYITTGYSGSAPIPIQSLKKGRGEKDLTRDANGETVVDLGFLAVNDNTLCSLNVPCLVIYDTITFNCP